MIQIDLRLPEAELADAQGPGGSAAGGLGHVFCAVSRAGGSHLFWT
jgi:hypothetical protein